MLKVEGPGVGVLGLGGTTGGVDLKVVCSGTRCLVTCSKVVLPGW